MSMDRCHDCGRLVDTDDDLECYVDIGDQRWHMKEVCICESCREDRIADDEEEAARATSAEDAAIAKATQP